MQAHYHGICCRPVWPSFRTQLLAHRPPGPCRARAVQFACFELPTPLESPPEYLVLLLYVRRIGPISNNALKSCTCMQVVLVSRNSLITWQFALRVLPTRLILEIRTVTTLLRHSSNSFSTHKFKGRWHTSPTILFCSSGVLLLTSSSGRYVRVVLGTSPRMVPSSL